MITAEHQRDTVILNYLVPLIKRRESLVILPCLIVIALTVLLPQLSYSIYKVNAANQIDILEWTYWK